MSFFERVKRAFVPSRENAYRPHLLRRNALLVFLGLALVTEAALVGVLLARQSGNSFLAAVISSEVISLTNTERSANSVGQLAESRQLDQAAQAKANDMAQKGYFAHVSPDGTQPWTWIERAGYDYQYAGENLAVRFVDSHDVVNAWMASPTHRANIVKTQYTEIGVATAEGIYKGYPATFVVQYFGKPSVVAPPVLPGPTTGQVATSPTPQVLGAEAVAPSPSTFDSLTRNVFKLVAEPRASSAWVLGGIVFVLLLALGFAFFHHIQLQAQDLLVPGTLVVAVALVLMLVNSNWRSISGGAEGGQSAAVAEVVTSGGVDIDSAAAAIER